MILTIVNPKGGSGKTTVCFNLGAIAALNGKKVCLIDLDPRNFLTQTLVTLQESTLTAFDLFNYATPLTETLIKTELENLSLVPATNLLGNLERTELAPRLLKNKLQVYEDTFDLILIDTPSNLGLLTTSAMIAATHLLLPVQAEFYSLFAIDDFLSTWKEVKNKYNPDLNLLGVLLANYIPKSKLAQDIIKGITRVFGNRLCNTYIQQSVKIQEAIVGGQSIVSYAPESKAAYQYQAVYQELMSKIGVSGK